MQFLPTWLPIIVFQKVEEQFPGWGEIMVGAVCLCGDIRTVYSNSEVLYGPNSKTFLGILS
jgi:hypothetical protein